MKQIVLIALRRPYTFMVIAIVVVLFGGRTIFRMPTDVFPHITIPVTSVVWVYTGMLPQKVEGRITYLFERFLTSTVEGIKYIHSSYAKVQLTAPVDRQSFTIPSTALVFQEHGTQVAVVTEATRVHLKPITVSKLMDKVVEVEEGLSASDRVINNPSAALHEGATVRVVTPGAEV
jgi:hypothetical protein